jgi:squalene cyclase
MTQQHVFLAALILSSMAVDPVAADPPEPIRAAVAKSLTLLQKSAAEYTVHRQCFSCHHQALPILAYTQAKARGFDVDEKELERQLKFTADFLAKNRANYEKGKGQGGQVDTAGYALLALSAGGWKADATTAAVVEYLLLRDSERDQWQVTSQRPPTEASSFTTTYLALSGLKAFGSPQKKGAIDARFDRAFRWLTLTPTKDTEDRVFRLKAFKALDADKAVLHSAAQELLKTQRSDGGWSQTDKLESDAYATGSVLAALHQAGGAPTSDAAYRRGIDFLLKTQRADGSWYVHSRSKPFQLYFESGFPHGKDQFISIAASSWATIALILCIDADPRRPPADGQSMELRLLPPQRQRTVP